MATPRGKIGRLPEELRNQVNGLLQNNATAEEVIRVLELNGVTGVRPQNISNWKTSDSDDPGSFKSWCKRRERLALMEDRRGFAQELVAKAQADGDGSMTLAGDTAQALAMDTVLSVLEDFDPQNLKGLLAEKPAKFIELLGALSGARRTDQTGEKLRAELALLKGRIDQLRALADEQGQATPDDIAKIFRDAYGVGK